MPRDLTRNLASIRARIVAAATRAGRDPIGISLVGVSKTHPGETIAEAWGAGLADFGENRVQVAIPKIDALRERGITPRWHMIGHLQRNKVAAVVERFDIIHTVDSLRLATAINECAGRRIDVLIEVNIGGEPSKYGVSPDEAAPLADALAALPHLELTGLMAVAPQADHSEDVRPVFRRLRELNESLGLRELSMGMTDDFEVAIEEGSTLVRVGRAIFGERAV